MNFHNLPISEMESAAWWDANATPLGLGAYIVVLDGRTAALFAHVKTGGGMCWARIPLGAPGWRVPSWDPITLDPSVHCVTCNFHGWVRAGVWSFA